VDLNSKEEIEINFWRDSKIESANEFTIGNFLNKSEECKNLNYKFKKYLNTIIYKKDVLEIGAGQGWASCFLKKYYVPHAKVTVSDISPFALDSVKYWEQVFDVKIDQKIAAKSYDIDCENDSFDLIFCYAAAHHFVKHKATLIELKRLLKINGHIIYLNEPTSSKMLYKLHYKIVNKLPHGTPEDVLIPKEFEKICKEVGLTFKNNYDPTQPIFRSFPVYFYAKFLKTFKFMQRFLPSSSDMIFQKLDSKN